MTHDGEPDSYEYASRLATWIWEKHYKNESPHWKPLNDLLGVLTQIDNMVTGLVRAQPEQEIESDRPHVEDDGCPTEKAVLQRFWREHQAQPEQEPYDKSEVNAFVQDLYDKKLREGRHGLYETLFHVVHAAIKHVHAPPVREWQGLTDEEIEQTVWKELGIGQDDDEIAEFARAIEAKLKTKNV